MNKATAHSVEAFYTSHPMARGSTMVTVEDGETALWLHGSKIARRYEDSDLIEVTAAGHATDTTRQRLRAVMSRIGAIVWQARGTWYWEGPITGGSTRPFNTQRGAWTTVRQSTPLERLSKVLTQGETNGTD